MTATSVQTKIVTVKGLAKPYKVYHYADGSTLDTRNQRGRPTVKNLKNIVSYEPDKTGKVDKRSLLKGTKRDLPYTVEHIASDEKRTVLVYSTGSGTVEQEHSTKGAYPFKNAQGHSLVKVLKYGPIKNVKPAKDGEPAVEMTPEEIAAARAEANRIRLQEEEAARLQVKRDAEIKGFKANYVKYEGDYTDLQQGQELRTTSRGQSDEALLHSTPYLYQGIRNGFVMVTSVGGNYPFPIPSKEFYVSKGS